MAPAACTSRLLLGLLHVAAALGNVGCAGLSSSTFPKEVVEGASRSETAILAAVVLFKLLPDMTTFDLLPA